MTAGIDFDIDGGIARVIFNNPEARNAINFEVIQAFTEFLEDLKTRPEIRVVLVTGAGDHFMAGADVSGFGAALDEPPEARREQFRQRVVRCAPWFLALEECPQVIVARVRGWAAGAGLGLVAGADLVIASENARFLCAQVKIGTTPDGSLSYHLPRAIGLGRAKQVALTGAPFTAGEAAAWGMVNYLVPDEELDAKTEEIVAGLAAGPCAQGRIKALLNESLNNDLGAQLDREAEHFSNCAASNDFVEGINAFLEKRDARFSGE